MESGEGEGEVGGPSPGRMKGGAGELLYMQEVTWNLPSPSFLLMLSCELVGSPGNEPRAAVNMAALGSRSRGPAHPPAPVSPLPPVSPAQHTWTRRPAACLCLSLKGPFQRSACCSLLLASLPFWSIPLHGSPCPSLCPPLADLSSQSILRPAFLSPSLSPLRGQRPTRVCPLPPSFLHRPAPSCSFLFCSGRAPESSPHLLTCQLPQNFPPQACLHSSEIDLGLESFFPALSQPFPRTLHCLGIGSFLNKYDGITVTRPLHSL